MYQSYLIYACTRAIHGRYSSVHVTFCGSWMHSSLNLYLEESLTGRKCRAYGTISYKVCRKITLFKTTYADVYTIVVFAVMHSKVTVLCTFSFTFFPSVSFCYFLLYIKEDNMYTIIMQLYSSITKSIYFTIQLSFRETSFVVYEHTLICVR